MSFIEEEYVRKIHEHGFKEYIPTLEELNFTSEMIEQRLIETAKGYGIGLALATGTLLIPRFRNRPILQGTLGIVLVTTSSIFYELNGYLDSLIKWTEFDNKTSLYDGDNSFTMKSRSNFGDEYNADFRVEEKFIDGNIDSFSTNNSNDNKMNKQLSHISMIAEFVRRDLVLGNIRQEKILDDADLEMLYKSLVEKQLQEGRFGSEW